MFHFRQSHEKFTFTIQLHCLHSEEELPSLLSCEWSRGSKRHGTLSLALVKEKKAIWDQTFTVPATLYRQRDSQALFEPKKIELVFFSKGSGGKKTLGSVVVDLSKHASLDGKLTIVQPLRSNEDNSQKTAKLTISCLWIREKSKSKSQCSFLSEDTLSSGPSGSRISHSDFMRERGGISNVNKLERIPSKSIEEDAGAVELDPIAFDKVGVIEIERADNLATACEGQVKAEDVLFLFESCNSVEKDRVLDSLGALISSRNARKSAAVHAQALGECSRMLNRAGINPPLFARLLDGEDVSLELQQHFDGDMMSFEFYLMQFVSMLVFRRQEFPKLVGLVLHMSSRSWHLALQTLWLLRAMTPSNNLKLQTESQSLIADVSTSVQRADEVLFGSVTWFVESLTAAARSIQPPFPLADRAGALRTLLQKINLELSNRVVYLPFCVNFDEKVRVCRIAWEDTIVFKTFARAPFMVFVEVVETKDPVLCASSDHAHMPPHTHTFPDEAASRAVVAEADAVAAFTAINSITTSSTRSDGGELDREVAKLRAAIDFDKKKKKIQQRSPIGHIPGWNIFSFVVKENDDLKQERFAMLLTVQLFRIFREANLPLFLAPYNVMPLSPTSGLIETVQSAVTLDSLKKAYGGISLFEYFTSVYGGRKSPEFKEAQTNFVRSMAGYSLLCYILQVKDRHGSNIMLSKSGYIIHIDFGFMLSKQQAGPLERSPFKLTPEFVQVMGGDKSSAFREYKDLMRRGFRKMRKQYYTIEMIIRSVGTNTLPCVNANTASELINRFQIHLSKADSDKFVNALIKHAQGSISTPLYDWLQKVLVGTAT